MRLPPLAVSPAGFFEAQPMKTMNNITHHVTTFDPASLPEPHNHPDRRTYLGGIDCAAILGLSPWKTPLDVYESKIAEGPQESDWNEQMYWGANLEDKILLEWGAAKDWHDPKHWSVFAQQVSPLACWDS